MDTTMEQRKNVEKMSESVDHFQSLHVGYCSSKHWFTGKELRECPRLPYSFLQRTVQQMCSNNYQNNVNPSLYERIVRGDYNNILDSKTLTHHDHHRYNTSDNDCQGDHATNVSVTTILMDDISQQILSTLDHLRTQEQAATSNLIQTDANNRFVSEGDNTDPLQFAEPLSYALDPMQLAVSAQIQCRGARKWHKRKMKVHKVKKRRKALRKKSK
ncbi:hypothetical protein RFI_28897 [Reticulomyxa filosa]|uniref:Uncharacterized protein n=1 Tax=Reticulomyxa filosa TaxID=46433 RepID=X6M3E4_RETFI|nr:hypothetical protein RFI_28897 [Reticulomyxa filosa]|eukprot:ETO08493.1 hypothetical protein RFI_28897 [Reticulomyxa filosa]